MILPKTPPLYTPVSTSSIVRFIQAPTQLPLRVDFAGCWLDVPLFAQEGGVIVNCAISPLVSLRSWPYQRQAGLGGSGAWALLNGKFSIQSELDLGVGWQDPAVIRETGCCVWQSGPYPHLLFKSSGTFLRGHMALFWTGISHDTPALVGQGRDYGRIVAAGQQAAAAVHAESIPGLGNAVQASYEIQQAEGMDSLPGQDGMLACKYCGGGWGGYALYLFSSRDARDRSLKHPDWTQIEPFSNWDDQKE